MSEATFDTNELDIETQMGSGHESGQPDVTVDPAVAAAYTRGLQDGGSTVFNAVMSHESNEGRGLDIYNLLHQVAEQALAAAIIVQDPEEHPLWEHLIETAFWEADARRKGYGHHAGQRASERDAFKWAVRSMLTKKLPAPDLENLELRRMLCDVLTALGNGACAEPTASMRFLAGVPVEVKKVVDGLSDTAAQLTKAAGEAFKSERRAIMFGDIVQQQVMAMRAAYVAWILDGPDAGMKWIYNTLCGPGHIPDLEAAKALGGAQALFDKEAAEHEAFRTAHPAPVAETGGVNA